MPRNHVQWCSCFIFADSWHSKPFLVQVSKRDIRLRHLALQGLLASWSKAFSRAGDSNKCQHIELSLVDSVVSDFSLSGYKVASLDEGLNE